MFHSWNLVNQDGLHVHEDLKMGDRFALLPIYQNKSRILWWNNQGLDSQCLKLWQNIGKHVKNIMLGTWELNRNMFLTKQDVKVLSRKLAQETYQQHKNNAKSVHMWVQQNTNSMFYYQEIGVEANGGLTGQKMPFTLGVQTPWQREDDDWTWAPRKCCSCCNLWDKWKKGDTLFWYIIHAHVI